MNNIKLGTQVRDTITGFEGVAIARTTWLHGCARVTVQPKELRNGTPIESQVFDELQLEKVRKKPVSSSDDRIGGPQDDAKALSR